MRQNLPKRISAIWLSKDTRIIAQDLAGMGGAHGDQSEHSMGMLAHLLPDGLLCCGAY